MSESYLFRCILAPNEREIIRNVIEKLLSTPHKLFHCCMPWLADALALENFPNRQEQDFDVQPE